MDEGKLILNLRTFAGEAIEEYDEKDKYTQQFDVYKHQCELEELFPTYMNNNFVHILETAEELPEISELKSKIESTTIRISGHISTHNRSITRYLHSYSYRKCIVTSVSNYRISLVIEIIGTTNDRIS